MATPLQQMTTGPQTTLTSNTAPPGTPPGTAVTVTEPLATQPPNSGDARFTAEQIEAARREEKDKLYKRITDRDERHAQMEAELAVLQKERAERLQEAEDAKKASEEAQRAKKESDMSAKALLEQKSQEWEARFSAMQTEREQEREALAKELQFNELRAYVQEKVNAERDSIAPELLDLVSGNSQEEVDASVALLKAKTSQILESVQQAQVQTRSQMRGVSTAGFTGNGPTDNDSGTRQLSAEDIRKMPMQEYAKYRNQLIGAASENVTKRGLFD